MIHSIDSNDDVDVVLGLCGSARLPDGKRLSGSIIACPSG
jgi:hypothetical protein